MKITTVTISIIILAFISAFAQQKLTPDLNKSMINWTGHAEIGSYAPSGTIKLKSGTIILNGDAVTSADIVIDMITLNQENQNLTDHLKSEDFFDVKKYPVSTVHIRRIVDDTAYGTLTVKDKTRDISFPVKVNVAGKQIMISGNTIINRTLYGIVYNSTSFFANLGDHAIKNQFDIAFSLVVNK